MFNLLDMFNGIKLRDFYRAKTKKIILSANARISLSLVGSSLITSMAFADLTPMEDIELASVSGQAFITIDNYSVQQQTSGYSGFSETLDTEFMKINIGADIETHLSIDHLLLGNYDRYENGEACPASGCDPSRMQEVSSADIDIRDFALGHYTRNSDGSVESHPFRFINPFFEVAFENSSDGVREVIGARIGFEQSGGILSGDIRTFTGNIDVKIDGIQPIVELFGVCIICVPIETQAQLQYGEGGDPNGNNVGSYDPIRAQYIGVLSEESVEVLGAFDLSTSGCNLIVIDTCHLLTKFQSVEIGKASPDGLVSNFFLSTQTKDIAWAIDPQGNLVPSYGVNHQGKLITNSSNFQQTFMGSFLNIPAGGVELTPREAANGLPRQPTRYTDAALGLF
jgi:hypothetical protein